MSIWDGVMRINKRRSVCSVYVYVLCGCMCVCVYVCIYVCIDAV